MTSLNIYAIDVTTSGVCTARIVGDSDPVCGYAAVPRLEVFDPATMLATFAPLAAEMADGVLAGGLPDLVVMNKLALDNMRVDPSGPGRAALWWSIAERLGAAGIPVAEAPPLLAAAKLFSNAVGGLTPSKIHERASVVVPKIWPGMAMPTNPKFRAITPVYAAAGVLALGGQCAIKRTEARDKVLAMMRLPVGMTNAALATGTADEPELEPVG